MDIYFLQMFPVGHPRRGFISFLTPFGGGETAAQVQLSGSLSRGLVNLIDVCAFLKRDAFYWDTI